jgi:hypothetical protein
MDDPVIDSQRARSLTRRSRIKWIGVLLIAPLVLMTAAALLEPLISIVSEAARRHMLAGLPYPPPPRSPGVYPVSAEQLRYSTDTALSTPEMPLATVPGTGSATLPLRFKIYNYLEGTTRTEPADKVFVTIYAPPRSWLEHKGRVLEFATDGEVFKALTTRDLYDDGQWKEHDRLDFDIPTEYFVRIATAKSLSGSLDGRPFTIDADEQAALRDFAAYLRPGIEVKPPQ